jgi:hypothetical protein
MRSDTIVVNGEPVKVSGLSVIQNLVCDSMLAEASQKGDLEGRAKARMRRVALAMQNGGDFIPDPKNPGGSFKASDLKIDDLIVLVSGSDLWANMDEYYEAEMAVVAINSPLKVAAAAPEKVASKIEGESQATAS